METTTLTPPGPDSSSGRKHNPDLDDLKAMLASSTPIIIIETHEEERILGLFKRLVFSARKPLFRWTVTEGLKRLDIDLEAQGHAKKPVEMLAQIKSTRVPGDYVLLDFHHHLDEPVHMRMLKDIASDYENLGHKIILVSHNIQLPDDIERLSRRFELAIPDRDRLEDIVRTVARDWAKENPGKRVSTDSRTLNKIVENLVGIPESDARRLARGVIEDDGALSEQDVPKLTKAKFDLLGQGGVLSFEYDTVKMADVGGLKNLKRWLKLRKDAFTGENPTPGLDTPKGIMLLGVQGCGKSLAAKAVAGAWGVPLLRMDFGSLYNKFYGETERNLRESLRTAEVMSPCVLWIDEIEKALSSDDSDGGTSKRVLGTLLTWLAEKKESVFIVSTANDISALPPELLRKGRLDEIFFVDLPDEEVRGIIFRIHIKKRDMNPDDFDLEGLAKASVGFSGSEIEQVVVSSLYSAFDDEDRTLKTQHLLDEIMATRPLSQTMAEKIAHLRAWGAERAVPAN